MTADVDTTLAHEFMVTRRTVDDPTAFDAVLHDEVRLWHRNVRRRLSLEPVEPATVTLSAVDTPTWDGRTILVRVAMSFRPVAT
jgi:hypothetical protein